MNKINGDVFSFKNKIFKISWVFEPSGLTEWDKKNTMFIIILQKILKSWLLIIDKKSNFSSNFKLEQVISYHIWFIVKIL